MNQASIRSDEAVPRRFDEKVFRRQNLSVCDIRWHQLLSLARYYLLHYVKVPDKTPARRPADADATTQAFPPAILQSLVAAGFVEIHPASMKAFPNRVALCDQAYDFAVRAHTLRHFRLLHADRPSHLKEYVHHVYFVSQLAEVLTEILRAAGVEGPAGIDELLERYVLDYQWPAWVARSLNEPLANRILDMVWKAEMPIPLGELPDRIEGGDPDKVRTVVEMLVARLALVEDIQPLTWDLVVGFLPTVREKMTLAALPRERPPLSVCEHPADFGPEGGIIVNDIRAVLLEIATEPPRLRQDVHLFQKEIDRFRAALDPVATWLLHTIKWSAEDRLNRAIAWTRAAQLTTVRPDGRQIRLHLAPKGQEWLSGNLADYHAEIFRIVRTTDRNFDFDPKRLGLFYPGMDPFDTSGSADTYFLGTHVTARQTAKGKPSPNYWNVRPEDYLALREHLDRAFSQLTPGVFYRLETVESHLVFRGHNPLNLDLPLEQVAVFWLNRQVPATRPKREEVGRVLINVFVLQRLIPFGCVRAAIDDEGKICIAREPRYDAFFGRKIATIGQARTPDVAARVVVQPDFSVIVIGLNPAPAAALAPFCERTNRGGGQGATVMKITRESVVKAVSNGLKPADIVARLKRHASNDVSANVLRQVEEWASWVRRVTQTTMIALRCPDSDAADRVMAVLKRRAERVSSTLVAIDRQKLSSTDRNKLLGQGILVDDDPEDRETTWGP